MKYYNVCTDETEDRPWLFCLWSRFRQLKYDVPRWLWFSAAVTAGTACTRCVQDVSRRLNVHLDQTKTIKRLKKDPELLAYYSKASWLDYYKHCRPRVYKFLVKARKA